MKAHPDARDVFNLAFAPVKEMYSALEAFWLTFSAKR